MVHNHSDVSAAGSLAKVSVEASHNRGKDSFSTCENKDIITTESSNSIDKLYRGWSHTPRKGEGENSPVHRRKGEDEVGYLDGYDGKLGNGGMHQIEKKWYEEKEHWVQDKLCKSCYACELQFSPFRRRHHCRLCGQVFCGRCSGFFLKMDDDPYRTLNMGGNKGEVCGGDCMVEFGSELNGLGKSSSSKKIVGNDDLSIKSEATVGYRTHIDNPGDGESTSRVILPARIRTCKLCYDSFESSSRHTFDNNKSNINNKNNMGLSGGDTLKTDSSSFDHPHQKDLMGGCKGECDGTVGLLGESLASVVAQSVTVLPSNGRKNGNEDKLKPSQSHEIESKLLVIDTSTSKKIVRDSTAQQIVGYKGSGVGEVCRSQAKSPNCEVIPVVDSSKCNEENGKHLQENTLFRQWNSNIPEQDDKDAGKRGNHQGCRSNSNLSFKSGSGAAQDTGFNADSLRKVNVSGSIFNRRLGKTNVKPIKSYPNGITMSASEMYAEMLRPSEKIEKLESSSLTKNLAFKTSAGSMDRQAQPSVGWNGQIGTLKVELLACVGLNKNFRIKPNAIAYFICGDVPFSTDIIPSTRSPMWPAKSKRAATFPIFHTYAKLYCGIFGATEKESDNFIGRAVVDIAGLRPNSLYDVTLPLRLSTFIYDDINHGVVRLRFSLHWFVERAAVLSSIPNFNLDKKMVTIPCADPKALKNVALTIHGEDLPGAYSRKSWKATAREIALYNLNIRVRLDILTVGISTFLSFDFDKCCKFAHIF